MTNSTDMTLQRDDYDPNLRDLLDDFDYGTNCDRLLAKSFKDKQCLDDY